MTRISDSGISLAVVGATGQVGTVMLEILAERAFPIRELRLFATARSAGSSIEFAGHSVVVEDVATADPAGVEVALFSAGATGSRAHAPRFAERYFRLQERAPDTVAMKARKSASISSGSSRAAKCPPRGMSVQCTTL